MKYNLIKYHFTNGSQDDWRREVEQFVASIDGDAALRGKIAYRAMRTPDGDYYHIAASVDDSATKELVHREFFVRYTEKVEHASAGGVEVIPLEVIAETAFKA
jgi:hypothetical protein